MTTSSAMRERNYYLAAIWFTVLLVGFTATLTVNGHATELGKWALSLVLGALATYRVHRKATRAV